MEAKRGSLLGLLIGAVVLLLGAVVGLPRDSLLGLVWTLAGAVILGYNDHRMAKSIEDSIDFAAKRQVWQRMILKIIRPMLIAMSIWQNSHAVLLRSKAAR